MQKKQFQFFFFTAGSCLLNIGVPYSPVQAEDTGGIRFFYTINNQWGGLFTPFTPEAGVWYMITATRTYNEEGVATLTIFINGEMKGQTTRTGIADTTNVKTSLGYDNNGSSYFDGTLRDIAIYKRALSSEEITQLYLATMNPEPLSTVDGAVLDLDGSEGKNNPPTTVWADKSGCNNHGTLHNFGFTAGDGWTGHALEFDGVDSYVDCGDDESLNLTGAVTIDAWVNFRTVGSVGGQVIAGKGQETPDRPGYRLLYNDLNDKFHFAFWDGEKQVGWYPKETAGLQANTWYHIVVTFNGTQIRYYLNGSLFSFLNIGAAQMVSNNPYRFLIGVSVSTTHQFFNGSIGGVRVYPRALLDSEVLQNYLAEKDKFR
jgi:hypothetical protein